MNPYNKLRNKILKGVTFTTVVIGIIAAMCLDMDSWIPTIVLAVCTGWLVLFGIANTPYK